MTVKQPQPAYVINLTNREKAERADSAIRAYMAISENYDEPTDGNLKDMMADVLHWCEQNGIEIDDVMTTARENFAAEFDGKE